MWIIEDAVNNVTNKVVIPADGVITISKPDTASVDAYVNDAATSTHQVEVAAGDTVYFKLTNWKQGQTPIGFTYNDANSVIMLPGKPMSVLKIATESSMTNPATESSIIEKETSMAEVMTPGMIMGMGNGGGDGLFGGGGGGGLIGGLILGSLLRQGNGGLFGNNGDGGAAGAMLRSPPEQVTANMQLMQAIGMVDKSVAVNAAMFEASQANQSLGLTNQLNNQTSSLATRIADVNQNVMENRYELSKDIVADGAQTRALITAQYEATLNRQLSDANAAVIALQNRFENAERTRGIEVNTTTTINQMQQQMQQQQQYDRLGGYIASLAQSIRSTNEAINVGSGTLTANPANTNTNIR
jgi:hypothetical protein